MACGREVKEGATELMVGEWEEGREGIGRCGNDNREGAATGVAGGEGEEGEVGLGRPRRSRMKKETREAVRWVVGWMEKAERRE